MELSDLPLPGHLVPTNEVARPTPVTDAPATAVVEEGGDSGGGTVVVGGLAGLVVLAGGYWLWRNRPSRYLPA